MIRSSFIIDKERSKKVLLTPSVRCSHSENGNMEGKDWYAVENKRANYWWRRGYMRRHCKERPMLELVDHSVGALGIMRNAVNCWIASRLKNAPSEHRYYQRPVRGRSTTTLRAAVCLRADTLQNRYWRLASPDRT